METFVECLMVGMDQKEKRKVGNVVLHYIRSHPRRKR